MTSDVGPRAVNHVRRFSVLYVLGAAWLLMAVALPSIAPISPFSDAGDATDGGLAADQDQTVDVAGEPGLADPGGTGGPGGGGPGRTARTAETAPPGVASSADGVARSGVACAPGARQILDSAYAPPCLPKYAGPTPRNLTRGVTATTIRVVRRTFPEGAADGVAASVGAGIPQDEVRASEEMHAALFKYMNESYELYGRNVEVIEYESRHGDADAELVGGGREGACADAAEIAEELQAFGVLETLNRVPFERCAAEHGLVVFNANSIASAGFFEEHHPYLWAPAPDCDRVVHQFVDYAKARLVNRRAIHAGDASRRAAVRKIGIYVPDLDEYQKCIKVATERMRREAGAELVVYSYRADATRLADQAQRAVLFFEQQGVTSIALACDFLSPVFLTRAATEIGYHPEWLTTGAGGGEDIAANARLYDPEQIDGHFFGRSLKASDRDILGPESEPGRIYHRATGRTAHPNAEGSYWGQLLPMFLLLQIGGPDLTAHSIAAGAATLPNADGPVGRVSFAESPTGAPGRDHTMIDNAVEVYWDSSKIDHYGQAGDFVATMGGRRFGSHDWPAGDPQLAPG